MRGNIIVYISILLYLVALTQDAFLIDGNDPRAWAPGWGLLLFGWIGIGSGGFALCWFANLLLFASWIFHFFGVKLYAVIYSILSVCMSSAFLFADEILTTTVPTYASITSIEIGYWLWLSSCLIGAFNSILVTKDASKAEQVA